MRFSRAALALLAAASLPAMAAVAQQAAQGTPQQRGPSPEMVGRYQDGKLAAAKAMLRLTPEQEKLWGPVEDQIRARFAERAKMRADRQAKRAERQASGDAKDGDGRRARAPLPERLDRATEMMTKRAESLKAFSTAVKPLYASLSDEQKLVANQVLGQFSGGGKGHHRGGWGHHGGRHHGWGGMRAEGGDGGWGHHRGHHGGRHMRDMGGPAGGPGGMGGDAGDNAPDAGQGAAGGDKQ